MNNNIMQLVAPQSLKISKFFPHFLAVLSVFLVVAAHAGDLVVDLVVVVENIESDKGNVRAAIFNNSKGFTKNPLMGQSISAKVGSVSFIFKNIPMGQYAVSAFHDMNANQKLDTNFVGKPVEPYGFSGDARGMFGPPSFEDASIQINENVKTVSIHVK